MTEESSPTPVITIADGVHLPVVGFGTYLISDDEVSDAVTSALDAGYRHVAPTSITSSSAPAACTP